MWSWESYGSYGSVRGIQSVCEMVEWWKINSGNTSLADLDPTNSPHLQSALKVRLTGHALAG
jgi:hypothetical protein